MLKQIKKAFTLAEVLITLAIIGVVATLTTPAIMRNSQYAKIGPQLAKIVTTLETGIQAVCTEQDKYYFKDVINESDVTDFSLDSKFKELASRYIKMRSSGTTTPAIKPLNGGDDYNIGTVKSIYMFSDKSAVIIPDCTLGTHKETQTPEGGGEPTEVEVTTNACLIYALMPGYASRSRLVLGLDIFPLVITSEGSVQTPEEAGYTEGGSHGECTNDAFYERSIDGFDCVNSIAKNGWKAAW